MPWPMAFYNLVKISQKEMITSKWFQPGFDLAGTARILKSVPCWQKTLKSGNFYFLIVKNTFSIRFKKKYIKINQKYVKR